MKRLLALTALIALTATFATAGQVSLAWDPPIPSNSVAGYKIYYGETSRVYTDELDAGNLTHGTVKGLRHGTRTGGK